MIGLLSNLQTNIRHKVQDQYGTLASFKVVKSKAVNKAVKQHAVQD